eukprot:434861-Hanusia_phi.AAC.1
MHEVSVLLTAFRVHCDIVCPVRPGAGHWPGDGTVRYYGTARLSSLAQHGSLLRQFESSRTVPLSPIAAGAPDSQMI